jgi:hypothetical protein
MPDLPSPSPTPARRTVSAAALGVLLCACACAPIRRLKIVSDPPGATVRVDETVVGETPLRFEFEEYGTRRVTLYKNGYRTYSHLVRLRPPWYARFPLDYLSEIVFPFGWKDRREMKVALEREVGAVTLPDLEGVLDRAEVFRRADPSGPVLESVKPVEPETTPGDG